MLKLSATYTTSPLHVTFVHARPPYSPLKAAYRETLVTAGNGQKKMDTIDVDSTDQAGPLTSKFTVKVWVHPMQSLLLTDGMTVSELGRLLTHHTDFIIHSPIHTPKNKRFTVIAACRVGNSYSKTYALHEAYSYPEKVLPKWVQLTPTEYPKLIQGLAETVITFVNMFGAKL